MNTDNLQSFLNTPDGSPRRDEAFTKKQNDLKSALRKLETAITPEGVVQISNLNDDYTKFVPRVSLIGQVKAGKTALTNGLLGTHGLLPSDVNPWTSVVTSMHVNVDNPSGKQAVFKFFSAEDWDRLVNDGGRIADLARRAKFDTKLDELTTQIKEMKHRTETRLGRNFEMLLGNQHAFSSYDTDLIKRYVCLGEDEIIAGKEGRFADLTKSADLYISHDDFNYPITISDTPGVNDPFLIREAATLDSLGNSHVCIVVLSAHQALSTVDLGLIRVLLSLQGEQVIVFVNRVDELVNPDVQIKEIDTYITDMMKQQGLPEGIPVIFGSAAWAEAAIVGSTDVLSEDSLLSLQSLVDARSARLEAGASDKRNIDNLVDVTGITALRAALDHNVEVGVYDPFVASIATQATQVGQQSLVYLQQTHKIGDSTIAKADIDEAISYLGQSKKSAEKKIIEKKQDITERIRFGISSVYRDFIRSEKGALARHLESSAPLDEWAPNTRTLRNGLNAEYQLFSADAKKLYDTISRRVTDSLSYKLASLLDEDPEEVAIIAPTFGLPGTPVSLMRTLTIDLSSGLLTSWLKRKMNKKAYIEKFEELALADMQATLKEIEQENLQQYFIESDKVLSDFLTTQKATLTQLQDLTDADRRAELQKRLGVSSEVETRLGHIKSALDILTRSSSSTGVKT